MDTKIGEKWSYLVVNCRQKNYRVLETRMNLGFMCLRSTKPTNHISNESKILNNLNKRIAITMKMHSAQMKQIED